MQQMLNVISQPVLDLVVWTATLCRATLHVPTCCQFALTTFCGLNFCLCWSVCHGLLCVFRDGGFLHSDLRNASALPGWHTKEQQWLVLLRQVQNITDLHLSFRSATQNSTSRTTQLFLVFSWCVMILWGFLHFCLAGSEKASVPRIKTTATFKSGTSKCNLKRSQEKLKESLNLAHSGTEVATQQA